MILNAKSEIFQINIPLVAHVQADKFRRYQSQENKAKQVYLNTLAVSTVNSYLNFIGWSTSLEQSDSWNPVSQVMMDVADLQIPGYGKLECRVVLSGQTKVNIPPEVWSERIGYIVVMIDESWKIGTVIGFVRKVNQLELPLDQLESLEKFPTYLNQQKRATPIQVASLSSWITGALTQGWQQLDELFAPPIAMNFRSQQKLAEPRQSYDFQEASRVKLVRLGDKSQTIALILNIQPQNEFEFDVTVRVCNQKYDSYLPEGLELVIVDQTNRPVMFAQASETETIEFFFSGELEEKFSVEVSLDEQFEVEHFII